MSVCMHGNMGDQSTMNKERGGTSLPVSPVQTELAYLHNILFFHGLILLNIRPLGRNRTSFSSAARWAPTL